jgi:hypothetical protein
MTNALMTAIPETIGGTKFENTKSLRRHQTAKSSATWIDGQEVDRPRRMTARKNQHDAEPGLQKQLIIASGAARF